MASQDEEGGRCQDRQKWYRRKRKVEDAREGLMGKGEKNWMTVAWNQEKEDIENEMGNKKWPYFGKVGSGKQWLQWKEIYLNKRHKNEMNR